MRKSTSNKTTLTRWKVSRSSLFPRISKSFSQMKPRRLASTLRNTTSQLATRLMSLRLRCKRVMQIKRKKLFKL